jgi:hypothetical protein
MMAVEVTYMEFAIGARVEATANGAKGVVVAITEQNLTVKYAGIGERRVPLDKASAWLRQSFALREEVNRAHEKALKENERRYVLAAKTAAKRARTYIPGTDVRRYCPDGLASVNKLDLLQWLKGRVSFISGSVKEENIPRFAANLLEANGQVFSRDMPGFTIASDLRWDDGLSVRLTELLPEQFMDAVVSQQSRCGCRKDDPVTSDRMNIFCSALAWELLREGYTFGEQKGQ